MATRIIPAKSITTCDVCGRECDGNNRRKSATLTLDAAGLDYQGMAVGPGGFKLDMCDWCCGRVQGAVSDEIQKIKTEETIAKSEMRE